MKLDIDGNSLIRKPAVMRHLRNEISRALGPFAHRIGIVRVRLLQLGSNDAGDTLCAIAATLEPGEESGRPWVLGRCQDGNVYIAVERAVDRVTNAIREETVRRDREEAMRTRALLAFSRTGVVEPV